MNYLCWGKNFNTQGHNRSEYVCISWSGAMVQLLLLGMAQAGTRVLFLGEREISRSKTNLYNCTIQFIDCIAHVATHVYK